MPCLALRCCAVLRCAFFRTCSITRYHAKYQACTCVLCVFSLSSLIVLPLGPLCFFPSNSYPYCRSERDIANKHTEAQHRTINSAQALGIIKSLVAPKYGPLCSAPFTLKYKSSLRERRGRCQPPAERSLLYHTLYHTHKLLFAMS